MAYLTYIIDHYHSSIPSVVAFLHAHKDGFLRAWHVDTPLHDNVYTMRHLQLDYVKEQGFVNLRCNLNPGCKKTTGANAHIDTNIWHEIFGHTSTPIFSGEPGSAGAIKGSPSSQSDRVLEPLQLHVQAPCCAQFAVSSEVIYRRPLDDYIIFRQWLIDTELDNAKSGRVLEFLWHIIFGREANFCPASDECYCKLYGRCGHT